MSKIKGTHLFLSLILLVTGFILSFSYQRAQIEKQNVVENNEWKKEDSLRSQILNLQKTNRELAGGLQNLQQNVEKKENKLADQEEISSKLVEDLKELRMVVGNVKVKGEGVEVTLQDSSYIPEGENPNDYIVHEEHIRSVIDELHVSGAEAIAINGQRISHDTYIACIGPVVSVDGNQYPAPFVITAIGKSTTLEKSLNLYIVDKIVNDGVEVRVEQESAIEMEPFITEEG
ncbi:DUF881 domain-containing protein [Fictibacillus sp. 5RED26]|uniref:DUF881 domain-containing protein n=1 Tax=unclassified Fictibacillus TaxID=2644029 RepID=UPI0018CCACA6|nr:MULTISPECIES: DUF881 domain-containing protein [unclassified Fictibacillus]MBH0155792.1 DUF881 domain-containing protein [Fictibacillus sp. 5RED26]MBH0165966.1 DUF881 domain-containing protein [Fictibacillus sp. 7GRE50]MBH0172985.1 DUF881 domain-containing protein [Fictibacillus sp. 23RED33]